MQLASSKSAESQVYGLTEARRTVAMDGVTDDNLRFCRRSHRDVATVLADGRKENQPFAKDCTAGQVLLAAVADRSAGRRPEGLIKATRAYPTGIRLTSGSPERKQLKSKLIKTACPEGGRIERYRKFRIIELLRKELIAKVK